MYWRNDWTGFFLVYFKWSYYLCVTPFRFEWDEKANKFRVEKNRIQKCVCAMQYILLGIWYLKDLRKIPVDSLYKNPVVYFTLAFNLNAIYYHCGVLATSYWRHEGRYLAIVNFDCEGYAPSSVKKKLLVVFLCCMFAILPLIYSLCGYQVISSSKIWNPSRMLQCLVVEGRFAFFLNGTAKREPCHNPPQLSEISSVDLFVALLAFLMETSRQIMGFYSDFFPLICSLSLWTSIGSMREFLEEENNSGVGSPAEQYQPRRLSLVDSERIKEKDKSKDDATTTLNKRIILPYIRQHCSTPVVPQMERKEMMAVGNEGVGGGGNFLLERYEICKAFSRTVNKALGQLLFAYVLSSIMYLSTCMDAVLVLQDWFGKLRVAFFFFVFILMFFIGSETVNKVYGVRAWLSVPSNNAFLSERSLLVIIHEVTYKPIGVSGNGMFTINYGTFMTVMTTTVTFFIIILQFQKPEREDVFMPSSLKTLMLDKLSVLLAENINQTESYSL